jgi:hypothetical protein
MTLEVWIKLEAEYKPKVIALAREVRKAMRDEKWRCSAISNWTDEDLDVSFVYYPRGTSPQKPDGSVDISFRLMDAETWDGTENGTSFSVDICGHGGEMIGGLHPYNYTSKCWVDPTDADAVRERWEEFYNGASDAQEIMAVINQFLERKAAA